MMVTLGKIVGKRVIAKALKPVSVVRNLMEQQMSVRMVVRKKALI